MNRIRTKRAACRVRFLAAAAVACAGVGSAYAANNNTSDVFTSGTALDTASDWSLGTIPGPTNDAVQAPGYPVTALAAGSPSLSSNQSFGSLDDLQAAYFNIYGGSTNASGGNLNNSVFSLTLGAGGNNAAGNLNNSNGVSGANPNDLIYVVSGGELDIRLGGNTSSYALVALNLAATGNFDTAGTGVIYDNNRITGTGTIIKTGTGTLYLESSTSTFTGGVVLNGGELSVPFGTALGAAPGTAATQLTFNQSSTLQVTGTSGFGSTRVFNISNGSVATIDSDGQTFGLQNPIIGTGSLVKIGTGTITFNSSTGYTYTGTTTINGGAIALNVSSGIPNTALTLGNSGSLYLDSGYRSNQSFPSVTVNAGASVISDPAMNVSGLALNLGSINRSADALVDFVTPTTGTMTTTTPNTNYSGGQQTILGGWATANSQTTWAVSAGTASAAGAITGLPQSSFDQTFAVAGADVDVISSVSPTVSTINSLRFNTGSSVFVTIPTSLTIASGGILQTNNVGSAFNFISGGTITSNSGELDITQAATSGELDISSTITDSTSGPISLVKSGAGVLILGVDNTFTGPTYNFAGTLELGSGGSLENSTLSAGTVTFAGGVGAFTIGGIGTSSNISLNDSNGSPVVLTFGGNNASTTFNGIFTGSGSLTKVGTGTTYLANGNSTFVGGFTIVSGTVAFIAGGSFGANQNVSGTAPVTIDGGAGVAYNQSGAATWGTTRGFTFGPGVETIQIGSINTTTNTSTSSLTIGQLGTNSSSGLLAGPSSGVATLVKSGLGTLILAANNDSYNGGTNVTEGTLVIQTDGSLGVSTIGGGYTGSGPLAIIPSQLFATVDLQDAAPQISSLTSYVNGNASAGIASLVLGSSNGPTGLTVGADNTSTTFGGNISDLTANYSSAVGSVTKVGTGVLTLSGSNTYKGGTFVTAGGLTLASGTAFPTSGLLNISAGTIVQIAAHTGSSSYVPVIGSLSNSGTIDITDNAMVIHNSSIGTIWPQIAAAYNGGAWNGTNTSIGVITSSAAAADTTHLTAVGVATGLTTFQGMNVSTGDVLVKDTYYGDANLDGQVTSADYTLIDAGYLSGGTLAGWQNGDFNYDGVINGSDYTLIDNAFNTQGAILAVEIASATSQIASISPAAVPEPSTLCLFAAGTLSVLGRRRRR